MRKLVKFAASLLFLAVATAAQEVVVPEWMYMSTFAVSDKSIFSSVLEKDATGQRALRTLLDYYHYMEGNMTDFRAPDSAYAELDTPGIPRFMLRYGWPSINNTQRVYVPLLRQIHSRAAARKEAARFRLERRRFKASERLVFDALVDLGAFLDTPQAAKKVKDLVGWKHVFHNSRQNYTTVSGTHRCKIRANIGFRINGRWAVAATVTNDRPSMFLADGDRKYLTEYLRLNPAGRVTVQPQFLDLNILPNYTRRYWGARPFIRNSTSVPMARTPVSTLMSEFGGQAGITFFIDRPPEENLAFVAALASSGDLTRQALDSRTLSNSAILVLPLFMAALPIGLFADVTDRVMLGYMVLTDFLSVLPLAIKGVELVLAGLRSYFSTRTRVWGDLQSNNSVVAATWSCRCESAMNLTGIGAAFIVVALATLVVGVVLEFVARAKVEKMKAEAACVDAGGDVDEYLWERKNPCSECLCASRPAETETDVLGGGLIAQMQRRRHGSRNVDVEAVLGVRAPGES